MTRQAFLAQMPDPLSLRLSSSSLSLFVSIHLSRFLFFSTRSLLPSFSLPFYRRSVSPLRLSLPF